MIKSQTLKFLKDLKKNNNKAWFDTHRKTYEEAKKNFEEFVQALIDTLGKTDPGIKELKAKQCIFRINRDIRFSKDKSPYKTNFGASINRGGKKSMQAGYYFHVEPGQSFAGGGLYQPLPEDLKKVRQEIDYNFDEFKKIVESKPFKRVFGALDKSEEFLLSRVPKGYEPGNPAASYLRLKSFIAFFMLSDAELAAQNLLKKASQDLRALQPLLQFLNRAIEA